jgi:Rap1a immunity proteins
MKKWAIAALLALVSVADAASTLKGSELLRHCDGANKAFCYGYVLGTIDTIAAFQVGLGANVTAICFPADGVSAEQARLITVKWLRNNPEKLHVEAGVLVFSAMGEAFPCENTPRVKQK